MVKSSEGEARRLLRRRAEWARGSEHVRPTLLPVDHDDDADARGLERLAQAAVAEQLVADLARQRRARQREGRRPRVAADCGVASVAARREGLRSEEHTS